MGLHRKESRSFNGFGKILTKTIKITKTEIETKEKPQILHFQVKNTGFCQQSDRHLSQVPVFSFRKKNLIMKDQIKNLFNF